MPTSLFPRGDQVVDSPVLYAALLLKTRWASSPTAQELTRARFTENRTLGAVSALPSTNAASRVVWELAG